MFMTTAAQRSRRASFCNWIFVAFLSPQSLSIASQLSKDCSSRFSAQLARQLALEAPIQSFAPQNRILWFLWSVEASSFEVCLHPVLSYFNPRRRSRVHTHVALSLQCQLPGFCYKQLLAGNLATHHNGMGKHSTAFRATFVFVLLNYRKTSS
jgi:hypothetical protein